MDEKGEVRRFVNVYVNEEDIRFLQNQKTPLKDGTKSASFPPSRVVNLQSQNAYDHAKILKKTGDHD